ncbi:hypothetical protein GCK72_006842 [Caenorhabditis remanei]|uniref:BTB domain-containing protein n=1 Tax=Caenorhabditis remanei TaxID=31234 RepID=A0A6A5HJW0_CAERE|nr:hypothetical protein GCK72_006842 [Caenorhabditis remanei]KAF1766884.1 hypothetical protein GCK72_006842 [Caenorhabditis remanei]
MSEENDNVAPLNKDKNDLMPDDQKVEQVNTENDEKNPIDALNSSVRSMHKICQELLQKQKNLEKTNMEIIEKLRSAEEKIEKQSSELQQILQEIQLKSTETNEESDDSTVPLENDNSLNTASSDFTKTTIPREIMPTTGKYFVLRQIFKNVSNMKENEIRWSEIEEHFGVACMSMCRKKDFLSFCCLQSTDTGKWMIEVRQQLVLISNRIEKVREGTATFTNIGKKCNTSGWSSFMNWAKSQKDFLLDDQLTVEIHVKIKKTTGIYKDNLRSFDETMEEFSDVVLVVNEEKFYVLKKFLAVHSSYFKSLFLGQFQESKRSEITLTGIDADDFQNYLELLYGDNPIDEITVEGILLVADMYDTPLVIRKCEEFLLKESKKKLKKKFQMSMKYHLEALKEQCLDKIKSVADIRSVLPEDIRELDPSIMPELLKKSLALHNPQ